MSHPDPLYDEDNTMSDDYNYDDYNDFYGEIDGEELENSWNDSFDDSMDGDTESALSSCGWGTDEDYGYYGDDVDYSEDFHSDEGYGGYDD